MTGFGQHWAAIIALGVALGCSSPTPPATKAPVAKKSAAAPSADAAPNAESSSAVARTAPKASAGAPADADKPPESKTENANAPADQQASMAKEESAEGAASAEAAAPSAKEKQVANEEATPTKPERIAVFTPGGPLLIDVTMTVDGRPYNAAFDERIAAVMEAADVDGDGVATWKELMDNDEYLQQEMAGRPTMNARQKRDAIKQYDLNDDGYVQKREAAAWLGRDAGRTAAAFRVRSSRSYVPDARTHSRVWSFIDCDGNGSLSAAELDAAGAALLRLDADDDQVLTLDELASLREQLLGQNQMNATSDAIRDAAILLEPGYTIERLDYILPDIYSPHQTLGPESFPALPKLFAQLDKSGEEWLDRDELAGLLTIEPHVTLAVEFNSTLTAEKPAARLTLEGHCDEVEQQGEATVDRVVLRLGKTRLAISATGLAVAPESMMEYGASQTQLQLMVHDQEDALFEELDANGDGRLGTREMMQCRERLLARDVDGDEELDAAELPYTMVVAFSRGGASEGFYSPPRSFVGAASGPASDWFRHADFNDDGDVSRREFLGGDELFQRLDLNGDGFIDAGEAAQATSPGNGALLVEEVATAADEPDSAARTEGD